MHAKCFIYSNFNRDKTLKRPQSNFCGFIYNLIKKNIEYHFTIATLIYRFREINFLSQRKKDYE